GQDFKLAPGDSPYHKEGLGTASDRLREQGVRRFVRPIMLAGKVTHEGSALLRDMVADRPAQHRITGLDRVEDGALGDCTLDLELHLCICACQRSQMGRQYNSDHSRTTTMKFCNMLTRSASLGARRSED